MNRAQQYRDSVLRNLAAELSDDAELCPECSSAWILPDTPAAKFGICPACWYRHLAEANRLAAEEIESIRKHDAARKKKSREMKKSKRGK